jgi:hypothetical protein
MKDHPLASGSSSKVIDFILCKDKEQLRQLRHHAVRAPNCVRSCCGAVAVAGAVAAQAPVLADRRCQWAAAA